MAANGQKVGFFTKVIGFLTGDEAMATEQKAPRKRGKTVRIKTVGYTIMELAKKLHLKKKYVVLAVKANVKAEVAPAKTVDNKKPAEVKKPTTPKKPAAKKPSAPKSTSKSTSKSATSKSGTGGSGTKSKKKRKSGK